jgi:Fe-S-cluster containining protein
MSISDNKFHLKLSRCDISKCEAMCCYDGAYLTFEEEQLIHSLVKDYPNIFTNIPNNYILDGYWNNEYYGRKTAVKKHIYKNSNFPEHFSSTRCVFADSLGYCKFEKLARSLNIHPWEYKPSACWLFPLKINDGKIILPPTSVSLDPHRTKNYIGFVSVVPCGKHTEDGNFWQITLQDELDYLLSNNLV